MFGIISYKMGITWLESSNFPWGDKVKKKKYLHLKVLIFKIKKILPTIEELIHYLW